MPNDFESRGRKLPHAALQLQKEAQRLRGDLCSRGCARGDNDATALPCSESTPRGQILYKTFQTSKKVGRLTDLEDPLGPWARSECIKVTERDLRRCGGNLGMLRQCAADHATDASIFEPFPSPVALKTSPCGAAGECITSTNNVALRLWSLKDGGPVQRTKESTILPRVHGRYTDFDEPSRVLERPGPRGQERRDGLSSGSSASRVLERPGPRGQERREGLSSGSSTTACSRVSSQCTSTAERKLAKRPGSQRGRNRSETDEWPSGDLLNLVW